MVKKLNFFRILRSEWIKIFSVRSTGWILAICFALNVAMSIVIAFGMKFADTDVNKGEAIPRNPDGSPMMPGDLASWSEMVTQGCSFFGTLVFMILSILIITNEYSSGMIRSTFTVAPRKIRVLIAKMIVISVLCLLVFVASVAVSWAGGWFLFLQDTVFIDVSLLTEVNYRILGGFIASMILIALFCFGLGTIIRSTAGSIGTAVGIITILPIAMNILNALLVRGEEATGWRHWVATATQFLPTNAGSLVTQATPSSTILGPWQGLGVLGGWALLAVVLGIILTSTRNS
jgi:ABC-2 type transport system permease protein